MPIELLLARSRGFCAGVDRAVLTVERALERFGAPVHVFHQIVHNRQVVDELAARGAVFVDRVDRVPVGAVLVFSAHGVSDAVRRQSQERRLHVIDASCPLVTKVHQQVRQHAAAGRRIIIIGHAGHDEVEGTRGCVSGPSDIVGSLADIAALAIEPEAQVAYVTQTTLSVDDTRGLIEALQQRFSNLRGPATGDICYATQNRQAAAQELARRAALVLVVGSGNSSNACRLREVAQQAGAVARLVEHADQIEPAWLAGLAGPVGVTAGASTPLHLVRDVCERLQALGCATPAELPGEPERVRFRLPDGLQASPVATPRYQRISNTQAGAPIAMQAVSSTLAAGATNT